MGGPTDAVQNQSLSVRCILMDRAGPPMLPGAYNNNYQIMQSPGYVMILVEMIHEPRIIPLDGRPHLPQHVRSVDRELGRPVGGRNAGRRNNQFHRQDGVSGIQREHASRRTVHAYSPRTRSSTNLRSTTQRRGPDHGLRNCRCRKRLVRFSSTPVTKETGACPTPSRVRGSRTRRAAEAAAREIVAGLEASVVAVAGGL